MAISLTSAELTALCQALKLPAVGRDAMRLAEEARRQGVTHLDYLGELLKTECHERETRRAARRIKEAGFPLVKTLEGFDFRRASHLPEVLYIDQAEPILFLVQFHRSLFAMLHPCNNGDHETPNVCWSAVEHATTVSGERPSLTRRL